MTEHLARHNEAGRHLARLVELIAAGQADVRRFLSGALAALDESSEILFGLDFTDLPFDWQAKVLERIEAGEAPGDTWAPTLDGLDTSLEVGREAAAQQAFLGWLRSLASVAQAPGLDEQSERCA